MTEPLTEEEFSYLNGLMAERDRDAGYITNVNPPDPMASEILMKLISGQDEIPKELMESFPHLLAIFQQYMPIYGKQAMALWRIRAQHSLTMYRLCHPHSGPSLYEETQIDYYNNILLSKGDGGFERDRSISTFTTITHQQNAIRTPTGEESRPQGIGARIRNALGGRRS